MEEKKEIVLSKPQLAVFKSRNFLILDMAGQGSGKTMNIGLSTGFLALNFPNIRGFIGANTLNQLSQSTLLRCFQVWKTVYNITEYDKDSNILGDFVKDIKPPKHFKILEKPKKYDNIISFKNGALIYVGALENYKVHEGKEFGWAHLDETKDTKEDALKEVILGRIRQRGLWYDTESKEEINNLVYDINITSKEAEEKKYKPFTPCYIHTSPSFGGVEWIIKLFNLEEHKKEIKKKVLNKSTFFKLTEGNRDVFIYQSFWNAHNLSSNYIENRTSGLTKDQIFLLIYAYPFAKAGGEYYHNFISSEVVIENIDFDYSKPIHLSFDFNVSPYITAIASQIDNIVKYYNPKTKVKKDFIEPEEIKDFITINVSLVKVIKEYCLKEPKNTTELLTTEIVKDCERNNKTKNKCTYIVYGDASGNNRITGLGSETQYTIIEKTLNKHGYYFNKQVQKSNIGIVARKLFLNKIFGGLVPYIEIYFNSKCIESINDFENLKSLPDGSKFKAKSIDKVTGKQYESIGHTSDAIEYYICKYFIDYMKEIN